MFPLRQLKREDYTIAWLCALPQSESLAAQWMLDEQHDPPPQHKTDMNEYQYGSIKSHNIVITCMPETLPGHVSATFLAASLKRDFSNVALHLFVGIGGGIPRPKTELPPRMHEEDVFLGDVVLGLPANGEDPAVVSYDLRRTHQKPDRAIVAKLGTFFRNAKQGGTHFHEHLRRLDRLHGFGHPGRGNDLLYEADFPCKHSKDYMDVQTMCGCGRERLVTRKEREPPGTQLVFHRGTICSANRFMADAETRDAMRTEYPTARCFEMEAAGVIDTHALVIRGITDYSDSHSNRRWQNYAAGAAAALTREIIVNMAPMESSGSSQIDRNSEHARCFAYNSISMSQDRFINRKGEVWEQMTVRGLSIYEIIYLECAEGSRRVTSRFRYSLCRSLSLTEHL
ncbi:hypothetical protein SLS58_002853 [Diplodia intermedia]|uniref:Nucleoside phosphorylase domain-containing protein n=1 Tax=Diplodia intermedia TaxID=856260 RepID=A0ABR3TXY8_9PEZI